MEINDIKIGSQLV